jgi:hypothetical protein
VQIVAKRPQRDAGLPVDASQAPSAINAARARERSRWRSATQRGYEVHAHRKTDQALRTGSEATEAVGEGSRGYPDGTYTVL